MLRKLFSALLSDRTLGKIDYYRFPESRNSWGGPFNGQQFRLKIFSELLDSFEFDFIVETGTFKGATTEYIGKEVDIPVFSTEVHERNYGFAAHRLRRLKNVHVEFNDSRNFISNLAAEPDCQAKSVLFYLDAHWNADLPLAEELAIILEHWNKSIILIDDFQVPDDPNYGYDDYGIGKVVNLDYLQQLKHWNFETFFPALKAEEETGARRGVVALTANSDYSRRLGAFKTLRRI